MKAIKNTRIHPHGYTDTSHGYTDGGRPIRQITVSGRGIDPKSPTTFRQVIRLLRLSVSLHSRMQTWSHIQPHIAIVYIAMRFGGHFEVILGYLGASGADLGVSGRVLGLDILVFVRLR